MNIRELVSFTVPPLILECIYQIIFQFYNLISLIRPNNNRGELIKSKQSKSALILGTGPSVNKINFESNEIKKMDIFTLSNFVLFKNLKKIQPKAHFIAAIDSSIEEDNFKEWINLVNEKLPEKTLIVTDEINRKYFQGIKKRKILYLKTSKCNYFFYFNINRIVPKPYSIPLLALPCLLNIGYKNIYFSGCDHNTLSFYKKNIRNFYKPNQDIRKNLTNKNYWKRTNLIDELKSNINLFMQYKMYIKYAKSKKINLFNLSSESWIDDLKYKKIL